MSFNIWFLLLLLSISLHACNARRLAVYKSPADDNLHISNPNEEKRVVVGASSSMARKSSTKASEEINVWKKKQKKLMAEKNGRKESVVSVPWRVPHSKHEDKHPGFNLDYSPPKIHPPSHN